MRQATAVIAIVIAVCVALVMGLSACSDADRPAHIRPGPSASGSTIHNDADVAFLQEMIPHHAQAIEMSDVLVAKSGTDPQVVAQARSIRIRQASEISMMRGWLRTWGVGTEAGQQPHHSGLL